MIPDTDISIPAAKRMETSSPFQLTLWKAPADLLKNGLTEDLRLQHPRMRMLLGDKKIRRGSLQVMWRLVHVDDEKEPIPLTCTFQIIQLSTGQLSLFLAGLLQ